MMPIKPNDIETRRRPQGNVVGDTTGELIKDNDLLLPCNFSLNECRAWHSKKNGIHTESAAPADTRRQPRGVRDRPGRATESSWAM